MNHKDINRIIARHWHIRARDINLPTRKDDILFPRLAAMLLCRQVLKMTMHQIRKAYGKRAVSTIHGALASASNIYGSRKQFRTRFNAAHDEAIQLLPEFRERRQRYNLHYRIRQKKFRVTTPHKTISITLSQEQDLNQDPQLRRLLKEHNYSVQYAIL